jgi:hypothetical protein
MVKATSRFAVHLILLRRLPCPMTSYIQLLSFLISGQSSTALAGHCPSKTSRWLASCWGKSLGQSMSRSSLLLPI